MRLATLIAAAFAVALLVVVPSAARVPKRPALVVRGSGFSLSAWDASGRDASLCFRLRAGSQTATQCESVLQRRARVNFTSFVGPRRSVTFLGGVARAGVRSVVATFANGDRLTFGTVPGSRYRGRRHGKVRFWAGRHSGPSKLKSLVAR